MRRLSLAAMVLAGYARVGVAQGPVMDSTALCDSIVGAAKVDSVSTGLFLTVARIDGLDLAPGQTEAMATAVATAFVPPAPFRVRVFEGPAQMRSLRRVTADTSTELRAPTVTGVYRFTSTKTEAPLNIETLRVSLVTDLDRAVVAAIRDASILKGVVDLSPGEDSMRIEVRLATDSSAGSRRAATSFFPRMPVVDAVPARTNPAPVFPEAARGDGAEEVLLRFVVDPTGLPNLRTVELARGRSVAFVRAAFDALAVQKFSPARVRGCAVSQVVYYPFAFVPPAEKSPSRH